MLARYARIACALTAAACLWGCAQKKEVTFESGGMTHTFAEGKGAVPKDFPLPVYPQATAAGSVSSTDAGDDEEARFLILQTKDKVETVSAYYRAELPKSGWEIVSVQSLPMLVSIAARKDMLEANVMVSGDDGKTTISLGMSKEAGEGRQEPDENFSPNKITPPTD